MGIFGSLFKPTRIDLTLYASFSESEKKVELSEEDVSTKQKELILTGALLIARFLRITPTNEGKKHIAENFIMWHAMFEEEPYSKELFTELLRANGILFSSDVERKVKRIRLLRIENANYNIYMDIFTINPLSKVAYFLYMFINSNLTNENQTKLLDICSLIAVQFIKSGLTKRGAVELPNQLVREHFPE